MKHSDTLTKIAPALVAALARIEGVARDANNPFFKSKYATLESVIAASKDILAEHDLALMQFPGDCANGVMHLETVFVHVSGEWIGAEMGIVLGSKADPQAIGSAISYGRRYAQMSALNMPAVDDDGERAMGRGAITPAPDGPDFPGAEGHQGRSSYRAKQDGGSERFNAIKAEIESLGSMTEIGMFTKERTEEIKTFPEAWRKVLREALDEQKRLIEAMTDAVS